MNVLTAVLAAFVGAGLAGSVAVYCLLQVARDAIHPYSWDRRLLDGFRPVLVVIEGREKARAERAKRLLAEYELARTA